MTFPERWDDSGFWKLCASVLSFLFSPGVPKVRLVDDDSLWHLPWFMAVVSLVTASTQL